jgi:acyl carrier protein
MNKSTIEMSLKDIFCKVFDLDANTIDHKLTKDNIPNWNSLKLVQLIVEVENKFQILFKPSHTIKIVDFSSTLALVIELLNDTQDDE